MPDDEKEIIELVIESTINGIESDIDELNYQYDLIINICKNAYGYFKIVDKIFEKLQHVYEESLERQSINVSDYILFYKQIYDKKIKTMVNDVHRTIKIEDEYLEYSKALQDETIDEFILGKAYETSTSEKTKQILQDELKKYIVEDESINENDIVDVKEENTQEVEENKVEEVTDEEVTEAV